jgi:hypothetical protein
MTTHTKQGLVVILAFAVFGTLGFFVDWPWWQTTLVALVPISVAMVLVSRSPSQ